MEEQFVTYEIALKLKELGFNDECLAIYVNSVLKPITQKPISGEFHYKLKLVRNSVIINSENCSAAIWQQVIDWFEEKYNLHIKFDLIGHSKIMHTFKIYSTGDIFLPRKEENTTSYFGECYESFKEAREQAILKVLELIK